MSQFSSDRSNPPVRFRPGPGQVGVQAAISGSRRGNRGDGNARSAGGGRTISPASPQRAGGGLAAPAQPDAPEPADYRHLILAAQHENMRRLGRDIPLGISMILNGDYRQVMDEGQRPFDWFLDLP